MRMSPWILAYLFLAALPLAGCAGGGDGKPERPTAPTTPVGLVQQLAENASRGRIETLLDLLAKDAIDQGGKGWMAYLGRTATDDLQQQFRAIPVAQRRAMEKAKTAAFLTTLREQAPGVLSGMFQLNLVDDGSFLEKDQRVLLSMVNGRSKPCYLAMERQADGTLRLLGEVAARQVAKELRGDLIAKMRAAKAARLKAQKNGE